LFQQIAAAIDNVLQLNGITPPDQQGSGFPPFGSSSGQGFGFAQGLGGSQGSGFSGFAIQNGSSSGSSSQFADQGSSVSDFLQQNGVSVAQFRGALFASALQSGGTGVDLSQVFQNASSGQTVNVTA
jgi:hypothetical protein